jgi:hypothetical protein
MRGRCGMILAGLYLYEVLDREGFVMNEIITIHILVLYGVILIYQKLTRTWREKQPPNYPSTSFPRKPSTTNTGVLSIIT